MANNAYVQQPNHHSIRRMVMRKFVCLLFVLLAGLFLNNLYWPDQSQAAAAVSSPQDSHLSTNAPLKSGLMASNVAPIFLPLVMRADIVVPDGTVFDMVQFMVGDGRLYEVQHSSGSQARHQTQVEPARFYHTKGNEINAAWEELWYTDS
jgi:hypothetical protein